MAVMLVTIALSAYMGVFILSTMNDEGDRAFIDKNMTDTLTIECNDITGDLIPKLEKMIVQKGYRGITVRCYIPSHPIDPVEFTLGNMDGKITSERFLRTLSSDDGRILPAVFEVGICV
jgi:hypothetical protein